MKLHQRRLFYLLRLFFFSEAEVAGVTQARNNVCVFVQDGVYGGAIEYGVFGEVLYYIVDSLLAGYYTGEDCLCRCAFCQECAVTEGCAHSGGKHGVEKKYVPFFHVAGQFAVIFTRLKSFFIFWGLFSFIVSSKNSL